MFSFDKNRFAEHPATRARKSTSKHRARAAQGTEIAFQSRTVVLKLDGVGTLFIRFATVAVTMLLTACTHYRYIDPQTPDGLDCLHKLDAQVNACERKVKEQQDNFDSLHETQARSTQQCEHFNTHNIPNSCPPPPSPTQVPNYCRSGYKEKYEACGGRIEKVED